MLDISVTDLAIYRVSGEFGDIDIDYASYADEVFCQYDARPEIITFTKVECYKLDVCFERFFSRKFSRLQSWEYSRVSINASRINGWFAKWVTVSGSTFCAYATTRNLFSDNRFTVKWVFR